MSSDFKYAQVATPFPTVGLVKNYTGAVDVFHYVNDADEYKCESILSLVKGCSWFASFFKTAPIGSRFIGELFNVVEGSQAMTLPELFKFGGVEWFGKGILNERHSLPLEQIELRFAAIGLKTLPFYAAPRFDKLAGQVVRHRHAGHGGVRIPLIEQRRAGWWLCDGNYLNRRRWVFNA